MFAHVCQKSRHAGFLCPHAQLPSDVAVWASAKKNRGRQDKMSSNPYGTQIFIIFILPLTTVKETLGILVVLSRTQTEDKDPNPLDSGLGFFSVFFSIIQPNPFKVSHWILAFLIQTPIRHSTTLAFCISGIERQLEKSLAVLGATQSSLT